MLLHLPRELRLDIESTDSVYLVAEEVDTERVFIAEGVDIDNASALAELPRLIHIVVHLEAQVAQPPRQLSHVVGLSYLQWNGALVEPALRHHEFAERLRAGDDVCRLLCLPFPIGHHRESCEHLGAQYLVGSLPLTIFHRALERGGEKEHPLLPHHLREVMVEIARRVGILQDEEHGGVDAGVERGEKQ